MDSSNHSGSIGNHSGPSSVSGLKIKIKLGGASSTVQHNGNSSTSRSGDGGSGGGNVDSSVPAPSTSSVAANVTRSSDAEESQGAATPHSHLPLVLGNVLTITDLGRIEYQKPGFHSDRYIFPVGFRSERLYFSYKNLDQRVKYICEILDLGGESPMFRVTPEDDLQNAVTSATPTGAWTPLLKRIQEAKQQRQFTTVSGPEYFGFANSRCKRLIEMLPNADLCVNYKKQLYGSKATELNMTPRRRSSRRSIPSSNSDAVGAQALKSPRFGGDKTSSNRRSSISSSSSTPSRRGARRGRRASRARKTQTDEDLSMTDDSDDEKSAAYSYGDQYDDDVYDDNDATYNSYPILPSKYPGCNPKHPLPYLYPSHHRYMEYNLPVFEGTEEYRETMLLYNEPNHIPSATDTAPNVGGEQPETLLSTMWEFAYICHCIQLTSHVLKIVDFEPEDLEQALLDPENNNGFLSDVHIRLMRGPVIDRKSSEYMDPLSWEWMNVLKVKIEKLDMLWHHLWEQSPLFGNQLYINMSPAWRVMVLKCIVDWKMDHTQRVVDYVRNMSDEQLRFTPVGSDRDGNLYYYLGGFVGRLFKEVPPQVKIPERMKNEEKQTDDNVEVEVEKQEETDDQLPTAEILNRGSWTSVCDDLVSLQNFAARFSESTDEREQDLYRKLTENVIPDLQAYCNKTGRKVYMTKEERLAAIERRRVDRENRLLQRANKKLRPTGGASMEKKTPTLSEEQQFKQSIAQAKMMASQPQPAASHSPNTIRFRMLPNGPRVLTASSSPTLTPTARRSTRSGRSVKRSYSELLDPYKDIIESAENTHTPTPAPPPGKRKRGRPRKYPRPEEDDYVPSYKEQHALFNQHNTTIAAETEQSFVDDDDDDFDDKDDADYEDDDLMINEDDDDVLASHSMAVTEAARHQHLHHYTFGTANTNRTFNYQPAAAVSGGGTNDNLLSTLHQHPHIHHHQPSLMMGLMQQGGPQHQSFREHQNIQPQPVPQQSRFVDFQSLMKTFGNHGAGANVVEEHHLQQTTVQPQQQQQQPTPLTHHQIHIPDNVMETDNIAHMNSESEHGANEHTDFDIFFN